MLKGRRATMLIGALVIAFAGIAGMLAFVERDDGGSGQLAQAQEPFEDQGITVGGEGQISVEPDTAKVVLGVEMDGPEVAELREEANARMDEIIGALQEQGVEENDIQTVAYDISVREEEVPPEPVPEPDEESTTDEGAAEDSDVGEESESSAESREADERGERRITGYVIRQLIEVTVRDIDATGDVIDAGLDAGANEVGGIRFEVEDREAAIEQARERAVEDARNKAEHLAELTGVSLGSPIYIDESSPSGPPRPFDDVAVEEEMAADAAAPIQPGESTISVNVNIIYSIE